MKGTVKPPSNCTGASNLYIDMKNVYVIAKKNARAQKIFMCVERDEGASSAISMGRVSQVHGAMETREEQTSLEAVTCHTR